MQTPEWPMEFREFHPDAEFFDENNVLKKECLYLPSSRLYEKGRGDFEKDFYTINAESLVNTQDPEKLETFRKYYHLQDKFSKNPALYFPPETCGYADAETWNGAIPVKEDELDELKMFKHILKLTPLEKLHIAILNEALIRNSELSSNLSTKISVIAV